MQEQKIKATQRNGSKNQSKLQIDQGRITSSNATVSQIAHFRVTKSIRENFFQARTQGKSDIAKAFSMANATLVKGINTPKASTDEPVSPQLFQAKTKKQPDYLAEPLIVAGIQDLIDNTATRISESFFAIDKSIEKSKKGGVSPKLPRMNLYEMRNELLEIKDKVERMPSLETIKKILVEFSNPQEGETFDAPLGVKENCQAWSDIGEYVLSIKRLVNEKFGAVLPEPSQQPAVPTLELPTVATERYKYRSDRSETPTDFFKRVWGRFTDAGVLYQDDIHYKRNGEVGGLDPELIPAIYAYCKRAKKNPKDYLPPPKSARINKILDNSPNIKELYNLSMAAYSRSKRNVTH